MRQSLLFVALYLLGIAVCLAVWPRRRIHLCGALGFPIGLAVLILPVLLLAAAGVPYGRPLVAGVALAAAAATGWAIRRRDPIDGREWRSIGLWTGAFMAVCVPLTAINLSAFTYDSHAIIVHGRVLADDGGFGHGLMYEMGDRGPFQMVAHSLGALLGIDYLYSLAPVLGLSLVAGFVVILWQAFGALGVAARRRTVPVALVAAVLFTVYLLQFHFVYIHENLASAVYLFLFAALFWLAEVNSDAGMAPLALIALAAFALHRIENPVAAALFGALALLPSRLPRRELLPWVTMFLLVAVGWNLALLVNLPSGSVMKLSATKLAALMAMPALVYACWMLTRVGPLVRLERQAPRLVAIVMVAALVAAFATKPDDMVASARAMRSNLTSFDDWGLAWIGAAVLLVLGRFAANPPAGQLFTYGVPLYLGLVLLLTYEHGPYIARTADSSMRMALHVLPLAFFYVGLSLARLWAHPGAPASPARPRSAGGTSAPA